MTTPQAEPLRGPNRMPLRGVFLRHGADAELAAGHWGTLLMEQRLCPCPREAWRSPLSRGREGSPVTFRPSGIDASDALGAAHTALAT